MLCCVLGSEAESKAAPVTHPVKNQRVGRWEGRKERSLEMADMGEDGGGAGRCPTGALEGQTFQRWNRC